MTKTDVMGILIIIAAVYFLIVCPIGFVVGIVMCLTGSSDMGGKISYFFGLPLIAVLPNVFKSLKRR